MNCGVSKSFKSLVFKCAIVVIWPLMWNIVPA